MSKPRHASNTCARSLLVASIATLAIAIGTPTPATADLYVSGSGAAFFPHHGDTGFGVLGQITKGTDSGHYRFGLEYEYREFSRDGDEIFFESNPDFELHVLRPVAQIFPFPEQRFSPYLGLGISCVYLDIHAVYDRPDRERVTVRKDKVGFGFVALLGLETKPFDELPIILFAEGRLTGEFVEDGRIDDEGDHRSYRNLGGFSTTLGIRVRF